MFFGKNKKWVQRIWLVLVLLIVLSMIIFLVAPGLGTFGGY